MPSELAGWTMVSIALFAIGARLDSSRIGMRLRASSIGRTAVEVARFVYTLGLPYAALWTGAFSPRDAGLQGSPSPELILGWSPESWVRALGHAVVLAALTLITLAVLVAQVRRAGGQPRRALGIRARSIAHSIRDAVYAEIHWSFYRVLPMVVAQAAHWAALGGLALVTLEAALAGMSSMGRIRLFEAVLAGLSATYFALTGGNLWIAIGVQIAVRAVMAALIRDEREATLPREFIV
jgi:hypothetical protein